MPKMVGSQKVECFRPINLCNELYKIIPKLRANQFNVVSKKYIGDEQNDFLKSKQIIDIIIIAGECIKTIHATSRKSPKWCSV